MNFTLNSILLLIIWGFIQLNLQASALYDPFEKVYEFKPQLLSEQIEHQVENEDMVSVENDANDVIKKVKCGMEIRKNVVLSQDLRGCKTSTALVVKANNITIDCNFKVISRYMGPKSHEFMGLYGIDLQNSKNVTVKNCRMVGFAFPFITDRADNYTLFRNLSSQKMARFVASTPAEGGYSPYQYDQDGELINNQ